MKIKSIISLLLAIVMLATALVGCGSTKSNEEETTNPSGNVETEDSGRKLPDLRWDRELRVLGHESETAQYATVSITAEAPTDSISTDVYNRNILLEEQYGITIKQTGESKPSTTVNKEYFAGESSYDLVFLQVYEIKEMMAAGCSLADLYDTEAFPYLYFEKDCWNSYVNETISINNKLYATTGYLNLQEKMNTALLFYNRDMLKNINSTIDPVALVRSGDWTLEKLAQLRADATVTDGVTGEVSTYGMSITNTRAFYHYVAGCEVNIIGKDNNDTPKFVIDNERTLSVIDAVLKVTNGSDGGTFFSTKSATLQDSKDLFLQGKALILDDMLCFVDTLKADGSFDYGFLPYPKYNTDQENYYSNIHSYFSALFAVPAMAQNKEFISFALQALNESSKQLNDNYIEVNCQLKGSIDIEALEMLQIATAMPVYDLGVVFGWGAIHIWIFVDYGKFPSLPVGGVNNFKTAYAAYEGQAQIELDRFLDYIK